MIHESVPQIYLSSTCVIPPKALAVFARRRCHLGRRTPPPPSLSSRQLSLSPSGCVCRAGTASFRLHQCRFPVFAVLKTAYWPTVTT